MKIAFHVRLALVAFAANLLVLPLYAQPTVERAWQLTIAGEPSGSFTEQTVAAPEGRTRTREVMALEMNRLGNKVTMRTETETTENADGVFESLAASISSSKSATAVRATRKGDSVEVESEAGGKTYTRTVPVSGDVLGPKGVEKISREKLSAPGSSVSYQIFSAELSTATAVKRIALEWVEEQGRRMLKIEEAVEGVPGKQTILLDGDGRWISRRQALPFGELALVPAGDERTAAAAPVKQTLPSESYDQTMARSNVRLPDPRTVERVTLELRHNKPELGWPEFASENQRVLEQSDTVRVVEVRASRQPAARGAAARAAGEAYLRPNALVQSDDPEVMRVAAEVTNGVEREFDKARRLQDWVSRNLEFDLGIALAPASEVVRNRRGTCIAYAVLLSALNRAAGLPSRVAMGYAYASGIWGGHAWTEVFVDGAWVAFDAALYAPAPADAARLWFGASAGDDQLMKLIAAATKMYGSVEFRVRSFEANGRSTEVPARVAGHEIHGSRYSNPWLGFAIEAPSGTRFTKTDAVFPDATIVGMEGPNGSKISIAARNIGADITAAQKKSLGSLDQAKLSSTKLAQLEGEIASGENVSCFMWRNGNSLWSMTAEGPEPMKLLTEVAKKWQWLR